jgi:hypothetical protein
MAEELEKYKANFPRVLRYIESLERKAKSLEDANNALLARLQDIPGND